MSRGARKTRGGQQLAKDLKDVCKWARAWTRSFGDAGATEEGRAFVDRFEREARVVFSRYDRARRALAPPYSVMVNSDPAPSHENVERTCRAGHAYVTDANAPGRCWCGERAELTTVNQEADDR